MSSPLPDPSLPPTAPPPATLPTAAPTATSSSTSAPLTNAQASMPSDTVLPTNVPESALYNFRVLAALRSGSSADIQPFIDDLKDAPPESATSGRLLGMAVRVASVPIIQQILSSPYFRSPNEPIGPTTSSTPLHVASENGRAEVVELLLKDSRIDDTVKDDHGHTALECASNERVQALIEDSRSLLQARYQNLLAAFVSSPLSSADEARKMRVFLEGPRVEAVNLNVLDQKQGVSLLHEAARRRNRAIVQLAVGRGADVFVRDRRGKRVLEGDKGADENIKAYLRQFNNEGHIVQSKSDGRPPDLKGLLSKWVNYRQGWKSRWFVLENGVLSYYRNRADEHIACRGSIALATAILHPSPDGTRLEVSSSVTTSVPKMTVKSSQRGEIARWSQAIKLNIEYYQQGGKGSQQHAQQQQQQQSGAADPDSHSLRGGYAASVTPSTTERALGSTLADLPPTDQFLHPGLKRTPTSLSGISVPGANASVKAGRSGSSSTRRPMQYIYAGSEENLNLDSDEQDSIDIMQSEIIPHEKEFPQGVHNIRAEVEVAKQLVSSIVAPPSSSMDAGIATIQSRQQQDKDALMDTLTSLVRLVTRQHEMSEDREKYLQNRIKREAEASKLWEESLLAVEQQKAESDRLLAEAAEDSGRKRRALRQVRGVFQELSVAAGRSPDASQPVLPDAEITEEPAAVAPMTPIGSPKFPPKDMSPAASLRKSISFIPTSTLRRSIANINEAHDLVASVDDEDEDDDDEFFDAIETGAIPNLRTFDASIAELGRPGTRPGTPSRELVTQAATGESADVPEANGVGVVDKAYVAEAPAGEHTIVSYLSRASLDPYTHIRHKLPIDDDKRPPISLWSILKSSIGKDLTKITFPVSFNECTSMLQRMAEDMEYDECLTIAASEQDSLKRIAYVGAFAMSNYSSTIGRIAKPFNPLLSQTFEYAIPHRYRYISEQVSHHPPISACYAEAPTWKYYGEVDAKNKFQGRYFEIRPTGIAHAELIIPKAWVHPEDDYPDAGPEYPAGYVIEHYSWKKVITNVSNFIMGSPIIDHYGDLIVTNHRTGETSTLTFKPRGWRGKDAFEIKGNVCDRGGNTRWDIAGRWDTQLIARRAGVSSAPLGVNEQVQDAPEYLQLWLNTQKPPAPFNLTPFAITLNDIPKGLEAYLPPTDCRLRTDQRAFENADYEDAQELKSANEEKQRETRKLRAEGRLPPHEPRWFVSTTDADSGERLWEPKRADDGEVKFWHDREEQGKKEAGHKWEEVDAIFVDAAA